MTVSKVPAPRRTQAERRAATRTALLDAAVDALIEDGYANLSTRRVAERAGVAQSTQMHYFPTREAFLVEALRHTVQRMTTDALLTLDLSDLKEPARREAALEQVWDAFTSPVARAVAQLYVAGYTEPKLAEALREFDADLTEILTGAAATLFPDLIGDPDFAAMIDASLALVRGLAMSAPIIGIDEARRRWEAMQPLLAATGALFFEDADDDG